VTDQWNPFGQAEPPAPNPQAPEPPAPEPAAAPPRATPQIPWDAPDFPQPQQPLSRRAIREAREANEAAQAAQAAQQIQAAQAAQEIQAAQAAGHAGEARGAGQPPVAPAPGLGTAPHVAPVIPTAPPAKRPGGVRRAVTAVVILALVGGVAWAGWVFGKPVFDSLTQPKPEKIADYPGPGQGEATITIEAGDPGSVIAQKLRDAGVIATTGPFIAAFTAAGDQAAGIQPGTYVLKKEMSSSDALYALMDPSTRHDVRFTVPEGKRAEEVYAIIGKAIAEADLGADAAQEELDQAAKDAEDKVRLAAQDTDGIGLPPEANGMIEGWLFPETYSFAIGTDPGRMLARMVSTAVAVLKDLDVPIDNWEETLTVASLVEREAKLDPDRPKVARVIENRLAKNIKLELDSTVVYGVGRTDANLATTDKERADPNPFNTYLNAGLPAGPIANPGKAAIEAALNPTPGAWMFFCVVDPEVGTMEFNETAEGHQKSVEKWQQWEREHGK
jgi:UPF0755 protein